ncbi:GntR family transcriptional regulator [Priestia megaterium]|uniref:GntR family transcriptional regulator n=1 Tax=Priestia megaterium TaxID=1404 RepID=UPI00203CA0AA|nr:GntR family transcriptional regulator [Priestia megaterium]MCM3196499.1 GntR family transcriptional regulator [Priestia megaterium]
MINKNSSIPLYYQIKESIKRRIESKEWVVGSTIPSEKELCELFSVSRLTVRQSIQELVDEGYLSKQRGRGTFILEKKIEQKLLTTTSFTSLIEEQGKVPRNETLSIEKISPPKTVQRVLYLSEHSEVLCIKRIRFADDTPLAVETVFLPTEYKGHIIDKNINCSLHRFIEENFNVQIGHGKQSIEASIASKKDAEYLQLKENAPLLVIKDVLYLTNKRPFVYVTLAYAGDRFKLSSELENPKMNSMLSIY